MVESQLRRRGIYDERVLAAMGRVPRELFVPPELREAAYADAALPIGGEQLCYIKEASGWKIKSVLLTRLHCEIQKEGVENRK